MYIKLESTHRVHTSANVKQIHNTEIRSSLKSSADIQWAVEKQLLNLQISKNEKIFLDIGQKADWLQNLIKCPKADAFQKISWTFPHNFWVILLTEIQTNQSTKWKYYLNNRRSWILSESKEDADAGAQMMPRTHSTDISMQAAKCQRMSSSCDGITWRLQPDKYKYIYLVSFNDFSVLCPVIMRSTKL